MSALYKELFNFVYTCAESFWNEVIMQVKKEMII